MGLLGADTICLDDQLSQSSDRTWSLLQKLPQQGIQAPWAQAMVGPSAALAVLPGEHGGFCRQGGLLPGLLPRC